MAPAPSAAFVTFETGQVRPLALSATGAQLLACNTPDNALEVFDITVSGLSHVASIPVGLEPLSVAVRGLCTGDHSTACTNDTTCANLALGTCGTEAWVVNHLSDSVSVVDLGDMSDARVVRTLLVGDEPRDIVFGGTAKNRAFITTAHRGQNTPLHATIDTELESPGIGRADVWVFDANNLGASLGGTPLTRVVLFGDTPRALAVTPDGSTVYAAVFQSGNETTTLSEGAVPNGCEASGGLPEPCTDHLLVAQAETGLIVKFDGSKWVDELGRDWTASVRFDLPDEDVFVIDANASPPIQVAGPGGVYSHVGTILFNMAVNPVSGKVYVSNTDAKNEVRFEGPGVYAGPFEAYLVLRLGVRHVDLTADWVHRHVEQDGSDVSVDSVHAGDLHRRPRIRVDHEHVFVRKAETHRRVPVAPELVDPVSALEFHDEAGLGLRNGEVIRARLGQSARDFAAVRDDAFAQRRRLIAGMEHRRIDGRAVR
jgi:DNA-binding beta-propeller fold protein YncE